MQPKKKRRVQAEQNGIRGEDAAASSSVARGHNRHFNSDAACRGNAFDLPSYFTPRFFAYFYLHLFICSSSLSGSAIPSSSSRSLSLKKNSSLKPHQVKMTQMPGMVRLGRREVNRSHSPTVTDDENNMRSQTPPPPQIHMQVRKQPPALPSLKDGVKCLKCTEHVLFAQR